MNPFEFVVVIVAIVTVGNIIRIKQMAKYGIPRAGLFGLYPDRRSLGRDIPNAQETVEGLKLREEVQQLKERIKVLERITVEKENSLAKEIESLRDR